MSITIGIAGKPLAVDFDARTIDYDGVRLFPVAPSNTVVIDFAGAVLSADKRTATTRDGAWRLKSIGQYTTGFRPASGVIETASYGDTLELSRVDNAPFTFNGKTANAHAWTYPKADKSVTIATITVEMAAAPVDPTPRPRWNLTIFDRGTVAENTKDATSLGYNGDRAWASTHQTTGDLTDAGDITKAQQWIAANKFVLMTLTPDKPASVYPAAAVKRIGDAGFDPAKFRLQVINECNLSAYWANGNIDTAYQQAVRVKQDLPGIVVIGPSITAEHAGFVEGELVKVEQYLAQLDGIDLHCYPTLNGPDSINGAKVKFTNMLKLCRKYADKYGILACMSEFGCYATTPADYALFPDFIAWQHTEVAKYIDVAAYYQARSKPDAEHYRLHLLDAAGNYTPLAKPVATANGIAELPVKKN